MEGKILCACCGRAVGMDTFPTCGYCGYINVAVVGDTTRYDEAVRRHRAALVAKLTDISVTAYQYGWMEAERSYGLLQKRDLVLADGPACDRTVYWTGQSFGQDPGGGGARLSIEIGYRYDGSGRRVTRELQPPAGGGYWDIGLEINEHLELVIHLGGRQSASKSQPIPFIREGGESD